MEPLGPQIGTPPPLHSALTMPDANHNDLAEQDLGAGTCLACPPIAPHLDRGHHAPCHPRRVREPSVRESSIAKTPRAGLKMDHKTRASIMKRCLKRNWILQAQTRPKPTARQAAGAPAHTPLGPLPWRVESPQETALNPGGSEAPVESPQSLLKMDKH